MKKRYDLAKRRLPRVKRLGGVAGPRVLRGGPLQGIKYGATIQGINDTFLAGTRRMMAAAHGGVQGRSCTARLQAHGEDPGIELVVATIGRWARMIWDGDQEAWDIVAAWRRATLRDKNSLQPHAAPDGPAGAYVSALRRLQWDSRSPFHVATADRRIFDLRIESPRTILELAKDAYTDCRAAASSVYKDIFCVDGGAGYGNGTRCKLVDGGPTLFSEASAVKAWAGGSCAAQDGHFIPSFEPLASRVKSAIRHGKYTTAMRSVVALAEGGWWTQLKRFAKGMAADPWCRACGPWGGEEMSGEVEQVTLHANVRGGQEDFEEAVAQDAKDRAELWQYEDAARVSELCQMWEDVPSVGGGGIQHTSNSPVDVGEEEALEAEGVEEEGPSGRRSMWFEAADQLDMEGKGAKIGCLVHKSLMCKCCEQDLDKPSLDLLKKLRKQALDEPWNPLFTRGVPLLLVIGSPPPYVEEKFMGAGEDHIAHGKAYTDGACKGVFRRTKRAGWGFIVRCSPMGGQWSMFGTCLDAYASALRSELWAVAALLQRTIPPLCIFTDNAEVVDGFKCGALYCCRANKRGADLWRRIWFLAGEMGGAKEGSLCEDVLTIKKVKGHLKEADVRAGKISFDDWEGNKKADALANFGAHRAMRLAPNGKADAAWKQADDFYKWILMRTKRWATDTNQEERRAKPEDIPQPRRERGPLGHALHGKWPHELWRFRDGNLQRRRCGRNTKGLADTQGFTRARCGGAAKGRARRAGKPRKKPRRTS